MSRPPVTSRRASPRCRRSPPTRPPSSAPGARPVPCAAGPSTMMAGSARGPVFRTLAAFDVIVNNADRKSGHCLLDRNGHIWGVDNGLTFHTLPKLRTVIWEFAGEEVAENLRRDARQLATELTSGDGWVRDLKQLISSAELRALTQRARRLADGGRYPEPSSRWAYPWPLI